jgi:hypothetical protein
MLQQRRSHGRKRWRFNAAIALFVLSFTIAGSRLMFAQQQDLTVKINGFTAADWSRAQAVVTVLDDAGDPVSGLTEESFSAQLNDTEVPTIGLSQGIASSVPLSVVLALDASAALDGSALDQVKLAAHGFIDGLGPQDTVAVITFGDTVSLLQSSTQDHAAAHLAVDSMTAAAGSALYEATVQSVLQASASADTGRRAVVLFSSAANAGAGSQQGALFAAQALGVPVFGIGLGDAIDREYLAQLAQVGGGQFAQTATAEGLVQLFQDVSELLREQYVLTLDASSVTLANAEPATLSITTTAGDRSGSDQRDICPGRLCVRLVDITSGEELGEPRVVSAQVLASEPVVSVTFYVDGTEAATVTQPPYQFTLDPKQFTGGEHALAAEITGSSSSARGNDLQVRFAGAGGGSSGISLMTIGVVAAFAAVALVIVAYFIVRRRGPQEPRPIAPQDKPKLGPMARPRPRLRLLEDQEPAPAPTAQAGTPLGRLHVVSGPLTEQLFPVGSTPASIGSGSRCLIRLPEHLEGGSEIAPEFARVWVRDGRLMLHELRRLTASGPVGGRWEMLEDGDSFSIGPCSFRFQLGTEERQQPATAVPPVETVPDALRSPFPSLDADLAPQEPEPDILRNAPQPLQGDPEPAQPIPDIFKNRPANRTAEEPFEESPPQAAAAP